MTRFQPTRRSQRGMISLEERVSLLEDDADSFERSINSLIESIKDGREQLKAIDDKIDKNAERTNQVLIALSTGAVLLALNIIVQVAM